MNSDMTIWAVSKSLAGWALEDEGVSQAVLKHDVLEQASKRA